MSSNTVIVSPFTNIINETISNHYNVADEFKNNSHEVNRQICEQDSLPFAVGAISVTGDLNIGMMIRSSSLLGASDFFIFGRRKYDRRSTVGAHKYINVHTLDATTDDIYKCIHMGYTPIFVEQNGIDITSDEFSNLVCYDINPLFLFGSESHGIPDEILNTFRDYPRVSIPQRGVLRSFNVSAAMNIVVWNYLKEIYL